MTALRLKDEALLVNGAGRGIGRDIATAATREGAAVTVADRDAEGATSAVAQIRAAGGQAGRRRRCRRCCHPGRLRARGQGNARRVRAHRLPRHQCGHRFRPAVSGDHDRGVGASDAGQPDERLPARAACRPRDDAPRRRPHRQHRLDLWLTRQRRPLHLWHEQGRPHASDPSHGRSAGAGRHRRQRHLPWPGRDRPDPARHRTPKGLSRSHPGGPIRRTRSVAAAAVFLLSDECQIVTGHVLYVDDGFMAAGLMLGVSS